MMHAGVGSRRDKCLVEVSIGQDRGQEPSNCECPDHISAVGTYGHYPALGTPIIADHFIDANFKNSAMTTQKVNHLKPFYAILCYST